MQPREGYSRKTACVSCHAKIRHSALKEGHDGIRSEYLILQQVIYQEKDMAQHGIHLLSCDDTARYNKERSWTGGVNFS
jgi:hypothetical protein